MFSDTVEAYNGSDREIHQPRPSEIPNVAGYEALPVIDVVW